MALLVKNSCKPGISVTLAVPRPAAEPGQMLRVEGGCGVYWGGGFIFCTTTLSECHTTSQRLLPAPQFPSTQWGSSYMQKYDEKRNRSEGARLPPSRGYSLEDLGA